MSSVVFVISTAPCAVEAGTRSGQGVVRVVSNLQRYLRVSALSGKYGTARHMIDILITI